MDFVFTFNDQETETILAGLLELQAKRSTNLINKIRENAMKQIDENTKKAEKPEKKK